jgi:hypothetical protein
LLLLLLLLCYCFGQQPVVQQRLLHRNFDSPMHWYYWHACRRAPVLLRRELLLLLLPVHMHHCMRESVAVATVMVVHVV